MNKKVIYLSLLLFIGFCSLAKAQTSIEAAGVIPESITWSDDIVKVTGDIIIPDSVTLTIDPGTYVEFQDFYGFEVYGILIAEGTKQDTIIFTVKDTAGYYVLHDTVGAWKGFNFINPVENSDTSKISFTRIEFCKNVTQMVKDARSCININNSGYAKLILNNVVFENNYNWKKGILEFAINPNRFLQIDSCVFRNNTSQTKSCIGINDYLGIVIQNCLFENNEARRGGALVVGSSKNTRIMNNIFRKNYAFQEGGAVSINCNYCELEFSNNLVYDNNTEEVGGGVYMHGMANNAVFSHNHIINNSAKYGGGIYLHETNVLVGNNIITNNSANYGGGIYSESLPATTIYSNTICNNSTDPDNGYDNHEGGGLYTKSSDPMLIGNIIHGNGDTNSVGRQVFIYNNDISPHFKNNMIQGGLAGFSYDSDTEFLGVYEENIEDNPLFVDPSDSSGYCPDALDADWSLMNASICINAGPIDLEEIDVPEKDILGNPRIANKRIDIGAIENYLSKIVLPGVILRSRHIAADTILVSFSLTIPDSVLLTIGPGSKVLIPESGKIEVLGGLRAIGSPDDSISFENADSLYFIDTWLAGAWTGIFFHDNLYGKPLDSRDTVKSHMAFCRISNTRNNSIVMDRYSSLLIEHSTIMNNYSLAMKSTVLTDFSKLFIESCTIKKCNSFYGKTILNSSYSDISINDSRFENNHTPGSLYFGVALMEFKHSTVHISGCTFPDNQSANHSLFGFTNCETKLTGNRFRNNLLGVRIGVFSDGDLVFANNLVVNNTIIADSSKDVLPHLFQLTGLTDTYISNNTIVQNESRGFNVINSDVLFENNIFHGNSLNNVEINDEGNNIRVRNCLVDSTGMTWYCEDDQVKLFEENIDTLPMFMSPSEGAGNDYDGLAADWSLMEFSPCINTGSPETSIHNVGELDLAGNSRFNGVLIDMGALEHQGDIPGISKQPVGGTRCAGEPMILSVECQDTSYYQWQKDGINIQGANGSRFIIDSVKMSDQGNYNCLISNRYGEISSQTVTLFVNQLPEFLVEPADKWVVEGQDITFETQFRGTNPEFEWFKDDQKMQVISPELTIHSVDYMNEGQYHAIISNTCGSDTTTPATLYLAPQLCMVTVDPATGNNLVVWEKKSKAPISHYNIYRESNYAGIYDLLATVPCNELSVILDSTADPTSRAYIYKITAVDTSGKKTDIDLCRAHKTIHLLVTTNPETNATQLDWDRYVGFDYGTYIIYRSDTTYDFSETDQMSSSSSTWSDKEPGSGTKYYRIAAERPVPCYPTSGSGKKADSGPYSHSMSNIEDNRLQSGGIDREAQNTLKLYPNPFSNTATLQFTNPENHSYTLYLTDISGKVSRIIKDITTSEFTLEKGNLKPGIYFIELTGSKLYRGKLVVE